MMTSTMAVPSASNDNDVARQLARSHHAKALEHSADEAIR